MEGVALPITSFETGIVIEDISWQTGLEGDQIESALFDLAQRQLVEELDGSRFRRVPPERYNAS